VGFQFRPGWWRTFATANFGLRQQTGAVQNGVPNLENSKNFPRNSRSLQGSEVMWWLLANRAGKQRPSIFLKGTLGFDS